MKRVLLFILTLVYFTTAVGANMHMHYCMGKLAEWDLFPRNEKQCGKCGMDEEDTKDCCKDEFRQVKLQTDQRAQQDAGADQFHFSPAESHTYSQLLVANTSVTTAHHQPFHFPLRKIAPDITFLCHLRI